MSSRAAPTSRTGAPRSHRPWTDWEDDVIRSGAELGYWAVRSKLLHRSARQIHKRARTLEVKFAGAAEVAARRAPRTPLTAEQALAERFRAADRKYRQAAAERAALYRELMQHRQPARVA